MEHNYLVALIIYGTILILTLIGIIVLFIVIHKQRTHKYKEALLHTRIEVQEQALDWVSREIHDNIGQVLAIIRMQLKPELYGQNVQAMARQMDEAAEHIGQCISNLRNMSHTLNSGMVEKMGLEASIEKELSYFRSLYKLECTFSCNGEPKLTGEQSLLLFRITQECLNNIVRHAKATRVQINFEQSGDTISLCIQDNGHGMNTDKPPESKGMGLANIRQRVSMLNGNMSIQSAPGKGTKILITIKSNNNGKIKH